MRPPPSSRTPPTAKGGNNPPFAVGGGRTRLPHSPTAKGGPTLHGGWAYLHGAIQLPRVIERGVGVNDLSPPSPPPAQYYLPAMVLAMPTWGWRQVERGFPKTQLKMDSELRKNESILTTICFYQKDHINIYLNSNSNF